MHRYDDATDSITKVLSLLPSYSEAYRISSFQAGVQGDLYKAAEELDRALEYFPQLRAHLLSIRPTSAV